MRVTFGNSQSEQLAMVEKIELIQINEIIEFNKFN